MNDLKMSISVNAPVLMGKLFVWSIRMIMASSSMFSGALSVTFQSLPATEDIPSAGTRTVVGGPCNCDDRMEEFRRLYAVVTFTDETWS